MLFSLLSFRRALALLTMGLLPGLLAVAHAAAGQALPASAWQRPVALYSFALYFSDKKGAGPDKLARELAASAQYGFQVVAKPDVTEKTRQTVSLITHTGNVATVYSPPSLDSLKYFGRGLSLAQAQALQKSPQVLILVFTVPTRDMFSGLLKASDMALTLANETGALIWDEETREVFTPEAWKKIRLDTWEGPLPDVTRHFTIHAYNDDGKVRAISLGMAKFALPDLVVTDLGWSMTKPLGNLVNAVAQALAEGARPTGAGQLDVRLASIRHAALRARLEGLVLAGGSGRGQILLQQGEPQEGDPDNTLAELRFDGSAGKDVTSRQTAFVTSFFGAQEDKVIMRKKNDAALLAASERAKKKLPALRAAFQAGLQPGESIQLKAPFMSTTGGVEWMWVEVIKWPGEQITGMLRNEPRYVPSLKAGQMVEIKQSEVFDYIRRTPDGKDEGNETGEILLKREQ